MKLKMSTLLMLQGGVEILEEFVVPNGRVNLKIGKLWRACKQELNNYTDAAKRLFVSMSEYDEEIKNRRVPGPKLNEYESESLDLLHIDVEFDDRVRFPHSMIEWIADVKSEDFPPPLSALFSEFEDPDAEWERPDAD